MTTSPNEIDSFNDGDNHNFAQSKTILGDTYLLTERFIEEYERLTELFRTHGSVDHDALLASTHFLCLCRYQLVQASAAILRGHLSLAYAQVRLAIESCAFAARVRKHPAMALVWLEASNDSDAYEKYRQKFGPGKLFPQDHAVLGGTLDERYDLCSKHSHPSVYALGGMLKFPKGADGTTIGIQFNYFQISGDADGIADLARAFLFNVQTHLLILDVFHEVFAELMKADNKAWAVRRSSLEGAFAAHQARWKPTILAS